MLRCGSSDATADTLAACNRHWMQQRIGIHPPSLGSSLGSQSRSPRHLLLLAAVQDLIGCLIIASAQVPTNPLKGSMHYHRSCNRGTHRPLARPGSRSNELPGFGFIIIIILLAAVLVPLGGSIIIQNTHVRVREEGKKKRHLKHWMSPPPPILRCLTLSCLSCCIGDVRLFARPTFI